MRQSVTDRFRPPGSSAAPILARRVSLRCVQAPGSARQARGSVPGARHAFENTASGADWGASTRPRAPDRPASAPHHPPAARFRPSARRPAAEIRPRQRPAGKVRPRSAPRHGRIGAHHPCPRPDLHPIGRPAARIEVRAAVLRPAQVLIRRSSGACQRSVAPLGAPGQLPAPSSGPPGGLPGSRSSRSSRRATARGSRADPTPGPPSVPAAPANARAHQRLHPLKIRGAEKIGGRDGNPAAGQGPPLHRLRKKLGREKSL